MDEFIKLTSVLGRVVIYVLPSSVVSFFVTPPPANPYCAPAQYPGGATLCFASGRTQHVKEPPEEVERLLRPPAEDEPAPEDQTEDSAAVEDQASVYTWFREFLPQRETREMELRQRAAMLVEEVTELCHALGVARKDLMRWTGAAYDKSTGGERNVGGEIADAQITLDVLASVAGYIIANERDARMARNRRRPASHYAARDAEKAGLGLGAGG